MVQPVRNFIYKLIHPIIEAELQPIRSKLGSLAVKVERLEKEQTNNEIKQNISDISVALKGVYELVNGLIQISSKR